MSQSERCVPALLTCSGLCSISSTFLSNHSNTSLKLERVCNIMAEKPDEKWWDHLSISCYDCLPTPSYPLLHAGLLSVRTFLAPSLFILQILSPSSKKDQSGAHTWQKFSAWMVTLKLYQKTGSSEVSDNLDRWCYQHCTQCSWLSSCHIELDRVFPAS